MKKTASSRSPLVLSLILVFSFGDHSVAKLADRSRLVKHRQETGKTSSYHDNGRPIEGQSYRSRRRDAEDEVTKRLKAKQETKQRKEAINKPAPWKMEGFSSSQQGQEISNGDVSMTEFVRGNHANTRRAQTPEEFERELSSQLSGCCYTYKSYGAANLCMLYGNDCESGETPSHDSGDGECSQDGLSFIGISFSVNTASGNPYSYQLCDQFPMENIIDRNYNYVMSMDEDGWLVGGGYKTFDYSGKMPYVLSDVVEGE
jgi:hypothetical protein